MATISTLSRVRAQGFPKAQESYSTCSGERSHAHVDGKQRQVINWSVYLRICTPSLLDGGRLTAIKLGNVYIQP